MSSSSLKLVLVSTPIGHLGSGRGGGVELTICSLLKGLISLGHDLTLVTPAGSLLPNECSEIQIKEFSGLDQPSWQHCDPNCSASIPFQGVLPKLWEEALEIGSHADAVLNFSYDWLPLWLTPRVDSRLFHLISMGNVSSIMKSVITDIADFDQNRLAFHTYRQAADFSLVGKPVVVGNGFDLDEYEFQESSNGPLGWAGRISREKGLEDAVSVAAALETRLLVWGFMEDIEYAKEIEESVPLGTIEWRGFLPTSDFQKQLGICSALINTPKWNEAYGNVVVEAMACGVPVVAYDRGGPGEIINSGITGLLVPPDDVKALTLAASRVKELNRRSCRRWVEQFASKEIFASRVDSWIKSVLDPKM